MYQHRIKEIIKLKGYTITSLAQKMGISRVALTNLLISPSYPTLNRLSDELDTPIWQFFIEPREIKEFAICPYCGNIIKVNIKIKKK